MKSVLISRSTYNLSNPTLCFINFESTQSSLWHRFHTPTGTVLTMLSCTSGTLCWSCKVSIWCSTVWSAFGRVNSNFAGIYNSSEYLRFRNMDPASHLTSWTLVIRNGLDLIFRSFRIYFYYESTGHSVTTYRFKATGGGLTWFCRFYIC